MSDNQLPIVGAACRHLRSKGMYVTGTMNPRVDDGAMGDGYCWCNKTQNMLGPDDQFVNRDGCDASRPCYEQVL
jgi:hypothetical protein